MIRKCLLGPAIVTLVLSVAEPALPQSPLLKATGEICADVKKFLDKEGKSKVRIGQFHGKGPEALRASTAPLLRESLKIGLQANKVEVVSDGGAYEITGTFQAIEDANTGRQAVLLSVTLDDSRGNKHQFQGVKNGKAEKYFFENSADISTILGLSCYLPPGRTKDERIKDITKSVDHPECQLDGTRSLAAKGSPFAMEIQVATETTKQRQVTDYKVKQPVDQKGLAFVPITPKEAYAVRLYNLSKFEVAVDLRLDGLNMYYFSEKRDPTKGPAYRHVIVAANASVEIRGWYVTGQDSDGFVSTHRANSTIAKAMVGNPAKFGTITAIFHRAWDPEKGRPSDEPPSVGDRLLPVRGQRFFDKKYTEVKYAVGTFHGSVSVRYAK